MATQADINALLEEAKCYAAAGAGSLVNLVKLGLLSNIAGGGGCTVPDPPVMLGPDPADDPNYDLNWTASAGATGYLWDLGEPPNFAFYIFQDEPAPLPGVFVADVDNASRMCRVRAVNACGISDYSNTVSFFTVAVPDAPVALASGSPTATTFVANWSAPAQAVTSYRLDVSISMTFDSFVGAYNDLDLGNTLFTTVTGLTVNTTYYYRVRAVNVAGTSSNSNVITAVAVIYPSTISQLEIWSRSDLGVYQDAAKTNPCTDGTTVYTWDNMGNTALTADYIQATAGSRPTYNTAGGVNGLPRISFNSDLLRLVSGSFAQSYTIVIAGKYIGNVAGYAPLMWDDAVTSQVTIDNTNADKTYMYAGGATPTQGTLPWGGNVGWVVAIFSAGASSLYTSGISNLSAAPAVGASAFGTASNIGGHSGGNYLIGDEYEVMLFSKALNATEITNLNAYLYSRYWAPSTYTEDDFQTYAAATDLGGLNGGQYWDAAYVSRTALVIAEDDFESYAAADPLSGLNGGTNWAAAYASRP